LIYIIRLVKISEHSITILRLRNEPHWGLAKFNRECFENAIEQTVTIFSSFYKTYGKYINNFRHVYGT